MLTIPYGKTHISCDIAHDGLLLSREGSYSIYIIPQNRPRGPVILRIYDFFYQLDKLLTLLYADQPPP